MDFVKLNYGTTVIFVVPEHVTHLVDFGETTRLFMVSGEAVDVDGGLEIVALKLQGRT